MERDREGAVTWQLQRLSQCLPVGTEEIHRNALMTESLTPWVAELQAGQPSSGYEASQCCGNPKKFDEKHEGRFLAVLSDVCCGYTGDFLERRDNVR